MANSSQNNIQLNEENKNKKIIQNFDIKNNFNFNIKNNNNIENKSLENLILTKNIKNNSKTFFNFN